MFLRPFFRYEDAPSQGVLVSAGQWRNRTTDTRIFSIRPSLSSEFPIDLNALIEARFWSMSLTFMF